MANILDTCADQLSVDDLLERLEELRDQRDDEDSELDADELEELATLEGIESELENFKGEWLINDDFFETHIEVLIEDCYPDIKHSSGAWPYRHVTLDLESAADEAKQDYTTITINGTDFHVR
jgi:hypothetical protein